MDGSGGLTRYDEEKLSGRRRQSGALNLTRLTGKHLRIVNFHLTGMKGNDIAQIMGMTPVSISRVLNDPLVKEVVQNRFTDIDNELFASATKVVGEKLQDEDPAIALRAADMVWRSRGRYEKRVDERPTAEDVVQKMLEIAARRGQASLTVTAGPARETPALDPLLELEGSAL